MKYLTNFKIFLFISSAIICFAADENVPDPGGARCDLSLINQLDLADEDYMFGDGRETLNAFSCTPSGMVVGERNAAKELCQCNQKMDQWFGKVETTPAQEREKNKIKKEAQERLAQRFINSVNSISNKLQKIKGYEFVSKKSVKIPNSCNYRSVDSSLVALKEAKCSNGKSLAEQFEKTIGKSLDAVFQDYKDSTRRLDGDPFEEINLYFAENKKKRDNPERPLDGQKVNLCRSMEDAGSVSYIQGALAAVSRANRLIDEYIEKEKEESSSTQTGFAAYYGTDFRKSEIAEKLLDGISIGFVNNASDDLIEKITDAIGQKLESGGYLDGSAKLDYDAFSRIMSDPSVSEFLVGSVNEDCSSVFGVDKLKAICDEEPLDFREEVLDPIRDSEYDQASPMYRPLVSQWCEQSEQGEKSPIDLDNLVPYSHKYPPISLEDGNKHQLLFDYRVNEYPSPSTLDSFSMVNQLTCNEDCPSGVCDLAQISKKAGCSEGFDLKECVEQGSCERKARTEYGCNFEDGELYALVANNIFHETFIKDKEKLAKSIFKDDNDVIFVEGKYYTKEQVLSLGESEFKQVYSSAKTVSTRLGDDPSTSSEVVALKQDIQKLSKKLDQSTNVATTTSSNGVSAKTSGPNVAANVSRISSAGLGANIGQSAISPSRRSVSSDSDISAAQTVNVASSTQTPISQESLDSRIERIFSEKYNEGESRRARADIASVFGDYSTDEIKQALRDFERNRSGDTSQDLRDRIQSSISNINEIQNMRRRRGQQASFASQQTQGRLPQDQSEGSVEQPISDQNQVSNPAGASGGVRGSSAKIGDKASLKLTESEISPTEVSSVITLEGIKLGKYINAEIIKSKLQEQFGEGIIPDELEVQVLDERGNPITLKISNVHGAPIVTHIDGQQIDPVENDQFEDLTGALESYISDLEVEINERFDLQELVNIVVSS